MTEATLTIKRPQILTGPKHQTVDQATAMYLREAATRVRTNRYWGSGVTALVADLLDDTANAIDATSEAVDSAAWTTDLGDDGTYPFVEDENANITGLGHQDPAAFADAVNRFDTAMNGEAFPEDDQWTADHVGHAWAVPREHNGEQALWTKIDGQPVTEHTPGALAITTLWGQR